jgi:hypothetical protein
MSKIVKISDGDYSLQVQENGNIIFDTTGTSPGRDATKYGTVTIWGNLDIKGTETVIESTNTVIADAVFTINTGLLTNGITTSPYQAGFQINRGTGAPVQILYDESVKHYDSTTSGQSPLGTFLLRSGITNGTQVLNGLQLRTLTTDTSGDLSFDMQGGDHALAIVNSGGIVGVSSHTLANDADNYAELNLQAYHIPNIQFLYNYVASTWTYGAGQGIASVNQVQWPLSGPGAPGGQYANIVANGATGPDGKIAFNINEIEKGFFDVNGFTVDNVNISNDTINNTANDLVLTADTGHIEINATLDLDDQADQAYTLGRTKLYSSSTIGPGNTGVYITNSTVQTPDELISRNRAVLLSILL